MTSEQEQYVESVKRQISPMTLEQLAVIRAYMADMMESESGREIEPAHWEAVPDDPDPEDAEGGRFWRVRWSQQDEHGRYLYVSHYGGNGDNWNRNAAERDAKRFNEEQRRPGHSF